MREQELHKKIREDKSNDNRLLAVALKKKHPEIMRNASVKKSASPKMTVAKRVAVFAPLAAAAVLAVVLIPTLMLPSDKSGSAPPDEDGLNSSPVVQRYNVTQFDGTVQDYNEINGTDFLFFDWDNVSEYTVTEYSQVTTEAFLGLSVKLKNSETNDRIEYIICNDAETLEFLEYHIWICNNESTVADSSVKWATVDSDSYGIFNSGGYDYYITAKNSGESRLFELIAILLY